MISARVSLAIAATVAVAAIGGMAAYSRFAAPPDCRVPVIAGSKIGGPFTLVDGTGASVTSQQVIDRPSLVYFGFTFCPDVCPIDLGRNVTAVDILKDNGIEVRPVFITVDPARDTPEVVADYAASMHPEMIGLTGSDEQIAAAAKAYGVYYNAEQTGDEYYLVQHTSLTYYVTPEDGVVTFFKSDDSAEKMAAGVKCLAG